MLGGTPEWRNRVGTMGGSETGWDVGVIFELVLVLVRVAVFELVGVDLAGYWFWRDLEAYYLFSNLEAYCLYHDLFLGILSRRCCETQSRTRAKTLLHRRLPQHPWGFEEDRDLERGWTRRCLPPPGTL